MFVYLFIFFVLQNRDLCVYNKYLNISAMVLIMTHYIFQVLENIHQFICMISRNSLSVDPYQRETLKTLETQNVKKTNSSFQGNHYCIAKLQHKNIIISSTDSMPPSHKPIILLISV